jgi:hypothetical protein
MITFGADEDFKPDRCLTVRETVTNFLNLHCVMDSLPENAQLLILNHDLTLA